MDLSSRSTQTWLDPTSANYSNGMAPYGKVGVGARAWQLCDIRKVLSKTHTMDFGLAFGWERWSMKKK